MGHATEELAERMGPAAGSLLNATFGNAAELILGIAALRHGHVELVKGSVTGSILANLLLVGGGSIVTGGIRFSRLRFNRLAASSNVATLFLAFVGVVIVAIVGNAAEHSTALLFANRGDMDVALGIAWESSKQIALLVAPLLVIAGAILGAPMDLAFTRFEVVSLGISVIALALIALDGETHWLEGAFLLAVYAVLGLGFFFVG